MCFQEDFFSSLLHKRRAKELKDLIKLFETKKKEEEEGNIGQTKWNRGSTNTSL